jgi:3-deoxy-manno-octulosonate cytidylyltransferase (CMP-KDO synthetase)
MPDENHSNRRPPCYGIIPARYRSNRFPGKPIADILGKPMIRHVYERARQCSLLSSVVLATDDQRIRLVAQKWDIPALMTRTDHPSGTDRVLEAAEKLNLPSNAIVINIQGDEPALQPAMLSQLLHPFRDDDVQVTTLARKIGAAESEDPNLVKVVFARDGRALYFSRSPIPFARNPQNTHYHGHIGLYAFRMRVLKSFVTLDRSRLETIEELEQLRLLENNIAIHVVVTEHQAKGVDCPEDIPIVSKMMVAQDRNRTLKA